MIKPGQTYENIKFPNLGKCTIAILEVSDSEVIANVYYRGFCKGRTFPKSRIQALLKGKKNVYKLGH